MTATSPMAEALTLAIAALRSRNDSEKDLAALVLEAHSNNQPLPEGMTLHTAMIWGYGALTYQEEQPQSNSDRERVRAAKKILSPFVFT